MKIQLEAEDQKKNRIYHISGELDVHQVKTLKSQLFDDLESYPDWSYDLDMKEVSYLDSSGLGMLVYLKKEITRKKGSLRISNLNDQVLSVFRMTKLEEFFGLGGDSKV